MAITIALCRRSCSAIHLLLAISLTTACGCEWGGSRICNLSHLIARRKRKIHNPPLSLIDSSKSCDISFWGNYLHPSCLMASTGKKRGQGYFLGRDCRGRPRGRNVYSSPSWAAMRRCHWGDPNGCCRFTQVRRVVRSSSSKGALSL